MLFTEINQNELEDICYATRSSHILKTCMIGGQKFFLKFSDEDLVTESDPSLQILVEYLSYRIYGLYPGVSIPAAVHLVFDPEQDRVGIATREVSGRPAHSIPKNKLAALLSAGIFVDIFLANWDVVGEYSDNVIIGKNDEKGTRIDPGGALTFRARGARKGNNFNAKVGELETMFDPSMGTGAVFSRSDTRSAAKVFQSVSWGAIASECEDVFKKSAVELEKNNMLSLLSAWEKEYRHIMSILQKRHSVIIEHTRFVLSEQKTNSALKQLISEAVRDVLRELAEPEAPEGSAFGQYLFAPVRKNVPNEPNTRLEWDFFRALDNHYQELSGDLTKMWPVLWDMKQKNQYRKFLEPPNKPVYRFLSKVHPEVAAEMLGISLEEIFDAPNKAWYVGGGGTTKSKREIQSWTIDPSLTSMSGFIETDSTNVTMLLAADPHASGQFLINPTNLAKETGKYISEYVADELEVISHGPVKITGAAYYYSKNYLKLLSKEEIKQLLARYRILDAPKNYTIPKEMLQKIAEELEETASKKGSSPEWGSQNIIRTFTDGEKQIRDLTRFSLERALVATDIYIEPKKMVATLQEKLLSALKNKKRKQ